MIPALAIESLIESDSPWRAAHPGKGKPDTTVERGDLRGEEPHAIAPQCHRQEDFIIGNIQEILDIFNNVALGVSILLG